MTNMIIGAIAIVLIGFIARSYVRMYHRYLDAENRCSQMRPTRRTRGQQSIKWAQDASTFVILFTLLTGCGSSAYIATPDSGRVSLECSTGVDAEAAQSAIEALVPEATGRVVVKRCVRADLGSSPLGLLLLVGVLVGFAYYNSKTHHVDRRTGRILPIGESYAEFKDITNSPNNAAKRRRARPNKPHAESHGEGAFAFLVLVLFLLIYGLVGADDAAKQPLLDGEARDIPVEVASMSTSPVEVMIEVIKPAPAPVVVVTPETGELVGPTITYRQRQENIAAAQEAAYLKALIPLAQVVVSETDRRSEMIFVAWAVRNRVDTRYRKGRSYTGVINAPYQFSAFGAPEIRKRVGSRYTKLGWDDVERYEDWKNALEISAKVLGFDRANASHRVSKDPTCRHFYAPEAMEREDGVLTTPDWTWEWSTKMDRRGKLIKDSRGRIKRFRGRRIPADFVVGRVQFYCGIA